ncbi:DUF6519 domain-containing protein [Salsipaludibacter albus]|uniref:DUF6519 domain-containing protein n=1 Tax=Salsipaludibacter albus TaxID=2849650 RepID=UPI001EE3D652|nr:DUF6519 domain-containing protein [Salsipaludibacter albus]MBY5164276.1 right-handed parallel beta-helix repeat-containing protein [Salsipaludibacter albus]
MGADISRVRFDALRDFAGVTLQQGRVLLDADFNDLVAIVDRRLRAETVDLTSFGPDPDHAGSSWVPRQTPDGFRISTQPDDLVIGRGRMYVDGLLAENHGRVRADLTPEEREEAGLDEDGFDPVLDEVHGLVETTYHTQPSWPNPDELPAGGPHLVYLDVWEREVTHVEDPDLVEVAVGVDSTARRQVVWQVRVLPDVGSGGCGAADDDLPEAWADTIRPSAGRLSVTTVPVEDDDDPCALPPTGGYRGLENQSYRVEVHDGGAPGTATFKWSRDNASVAMPVVEVVSSTVLRLATVGRDDVLRVSTGDWVEVLDDHRELDQRPGVMRRVTVDDAARTITFDDALPGDLQPADDVEVAARHLRVRRWDQSGPVRTAAGATVGNVDDDGGLVGVPAMATTRVVLEHGIVVSFDLSGDPALAGAGFRSGDHWIVAARTADTSVEELDNAPPLGIHHHYARLATVTFDDSQTDCRRLWPPIATGGGDDCGDCTVCVTPTSHASGELTLQMAVDLVRETGGTICLAVGVYDLGDGVNLDGARAVRIRGQGLATILVARGTAITTTSAIDLTIERLAIVSGVESSAAIRWRNVLRGRLRETAILSYGSDDVEAAAVQLTGVQAWVSLQDNLLVAQRAVRGGDAEVGVLSAGLDVVDNLLGGDVGVDLGAGSIHVGSTRVADNDVLVGDGVGIVAPGAVWPDATLAITGNVVGTFGGGIVAGGRARITDNVVTGVGERGTDGIVLVPGRFDLPPGDVVVAGNRVAEMAGEGISLRTPVVSLAVTDNVVARVGAGITVSARGRAEDLSVTGNRVREVAGLGDDRRTAWGIGVTGAGTVVVTDNVVTDVGVEQVEGILRAGVLVTGSRDVRVSGNRVDRVGPREPFVGLAAGIVVVGPFAAAGLHENTVRFHDGAEPPPQARWVALLVTPATQALLFSRRESVRAGRRHTVAIDRGAVVLTDGWARLVDQAGEHVTVSDNHLAGGGLLPAGLVSVSGDAVVDANQCDQSDGQFVGLAVGGSSVTASTNRVRGPEASIVLVTREDRIAAVGNLAPGGTHLGSSGAGLPGPWDTLNPNVS